MASGTKYGNQQRWRKTNFLFCFLNSTLNNEHRLIWTDEKRYACDVGDCNMRFKTSSKLSRHKKTHNKNAAFTCNVCEKRMMRKEHLQSHQLTHCSNKTFQCLFESCQKRFAGRPLLLDHIRKVHKRGKEGMSPLLCPLPDCSKRYFL